jgi:hypothetical protein
MERLRKLPMEQARAAFTASGKPAEQAVVASGKRMNTVVRAMARQGYDTTVSVRIVPGTSLGDLLRPKRCEPRKGAQRREADPFDLPAGLIERLREVDKSVVAWLAKDQANARLFLARPAEALAQAAADLDRADLKALDRAHQAVREATVVAPGVRVADLKAEAFPNGRVGDIKPAGIGGGKTRSGCAKEE